MFMSLRAWIISVRRVLHPHSRLLLVLLIIFSLDILHYFLYRNFTFFTFRRQMLISLLVQFDKTQFDFCKIEKLRIEAIRLDQFLYPHHLLSSKSNETFAKFKCDNSSNFYQNVLTNDTSNLFLLERLYNPRKIIQISALLVIKVVNKLGKK